MSEWSFILRLNQPLTAEQANTFDHCDAFADGSVSYVLGPEHPSRFAVHTDPAELSELSCDIEAPSFLGATRISGAAARSAGSDGYSWRKIAEFLRSIGDTVPETPRELAVAAQVLRLAHELESLEVKPGTLRALGLAGCLRPPT
ncbi:hypothetical protein P3L51_02810 [Streptomyces sp. PSRA5]|uniref:hypothetical protein n=1 Tax=Streptomyces panacea TaxID=3035064 RepID=UPI00339CA105